MGAFMKACYRKIGLFLISMVGVGAAVAQERDVSTIVGRALVSPPLAEDLRRLTDEVGGRVSGTPAMARAVAWATSAFRSTGVETHTEHYTMPLTWSEGATRLEVLGGSAFPVSLVAEGWSSPTPAEGIEAELVHIGDGTEADFSRAGGKTRGAIGRRAGFRADRLTERKRFPWSHLCASGDSAWPSFLQWCCTNFHLSSPARANVPENFQP